jgi:hypothetical protein
MWPARAADPTTRCSFGGPAGTSRVFRLSLPAGSSFLRVTQSGTRVSRPTGTTSSWHLATGVFVIDEATQRIVSHRISNEGTATRRTVVDAEGTGLPRTDVTTPGPDTPFIHSDLSTVPGLAPGSYLVVAFGSDGDAALPNDGWGGYVEVSGAHTCEFLDAGRILDVNHADFSGGTQVSTYGAGYVDGASLTRGLASDLVVGFMDAGTQVVGDAALDYAMPSGTGTVQDAIVPFVSTGGPFEWTAHLTGVSPIVSIAGVEVNLP